MKAISQKMCLRSALCSAFAKQSRFLASGVLDNPVSNAVIVCCLLSTFPVIGYPPILRAIMVRRRRLPPLPLSSAAAVFRRRHLRRSHHHHSSVSADSHRTLSSFPVIVLKKYARYYVTESVTL
jgi:hypothetical protein